MGREPAPVDVQAHLAVVDRRDVAIGRREVGLDGRELGGAVRVEEVAVHCP